MKFKARIKNNQLQVKVKFSSSETLSQREAYILSTKPVRGLLRPGYIKKNIIEYMGPAGIPLCDYLRGTLTKYDVFYFMAQIVTATKKVRNNELFLNNVVFDSRYVYVNPATKEMQFVYTPIQSNHTCPDIIGFMQEILYSVRLTGKEGADIARFADFIRQQDTFECSKIEEFIMKEESEAGSLIRRYNNQSGYLTDKRQDYYEHYDKKNEDDGATELLDDEATQVLDDEATGLLDSGSTEPDTVHYAGLTRRVNDEYIEINKAVFRLGKGKGCVDYFVGNNNAVSRSHADIITRGAQYFIYDQNSTNHTYVNGEIIPVKIEVEIFDGDEIRLADEEFIFHI